MAGTIGRVTASMATAHNENSVALANLNFDFTLIKLEAPVEYNGLGATISRKRKTNAEEGSLHKTARRLGALFKDILPPTEDLFRAYGKRVSEISRMPAVNPQVSDGDGIFASHIGADTTSIWAAATSGNAAIAVHLLGCMLARIFTAPEAVSIWVELVEKRKESIRVQQGNALYLQEQESAIIAARQDITRADLAGWDASARSWLQTADQAKALQHKQTMLILNNASVPVNKERDTYTSVVMAWTAALKSMNNLVQGIPQRVQDGAALLAISSWHLYPNMVVFTEGCVDINQHDPIFDRTALLTLGLKEVQHRRSPTESIYWSLPLAYLQYYGNPVQASRTVGQENSRITYEQFMYVVLGCIFDGWREYATTNDEGAQWVTRLGELLGLDYLEKQPWLHYLFVAARGLNNCDEWERKAAHQLMNLGRRRSTFLTAPGRFPSPLFGLADTDVLLWILTGNEQRIQCLRQLVSHLKLGSRFLVRYYSQTSFDYATVKPVRHQQLSTKRMRDGDKKGVGQLSSTYLRWIHLSIDELKLCTNKSEELLHPLETKEKIEQLIWRLDDLKRESAILAMNSERSEQQEDRDSRILKLREEIDELEMISYICQRMKHVEELGEICLPFVEDIEHPPHQFRGQVSKEGLLLGEGTEFLDACRALLLKLDSPQRIRRLISPTFVAGDINMVSLVSTHPSHIKEIPKPSLSPSFLEEFFVSKYVNVEELRSYLQTSHQSVERENTPHEFVLRQMASLQACAIMADLYRQLPGATISTLVVRQSLNQARWIPQPLKYYDYPDEASQLTLSQAFACMAMFESGITNLDPEELSQVFAMSSGNSLYVCGILLSDPYEPQRFSDIRRVVGNIGRSGITFLISPPEVKLREADPEKWMAINHNPFDGKLEDHFRETSIHLSFTEYEIALAVEGKARHSIDRDVFLVESLISVYDKGEWVGELDILSAFGSRIVRLACDSNHEKKATSLQISQRILQLNATAVENWDELIEAPNTGGIAIRTHKNWLARLAATAVCVKIGFQPCIMSEDPCWTCCLQLISSYNNSKFALIC